MNAVHRLVLATGNAGKVREIGALLAPLGIEIISQAGFGLDSADETGATFVENAILKARHAAGGSGLPAIADDSGLVVDALNGEPGIYSARYAGDAGDAGNVRKLLDALEGVPTSRRRARFVCVAVCLRHADDPLPLVSEGHWEGTISLAPRGDGGFGYDPVFIPLGDTRTAAELPPEEKNRLSHRGRAFTELLGRLRAELSGGARAEGRAS